ncbi:MAG: hypothetical protein ABEJ31_02580 [Haloarculaceae archaeon]
MQTRQLLLVAVVAAAVALAGCGALQQGSGPNGNQTQGPGGDNAEWPATLPASADGTHAQLLANADGYVSVLNLTVRSQQQSSGSGTTHIDSVYRIDNRRSAYLLRRSVGAGAFEQTTTRFTNDTATYLRSQYGGQASYSSDTPPYDGSSIGSVKPVNATEAQGPRISTLFNFSAGGVDASAVTYAKTGTDTVDGRKVAVYAANATQLRRAMQRATNASSSSSQNRITNATATVERTADGLLVSKHLRVAFHSENGDGSLEYDYRVRQVGDVTVSPPEWVPKAAQGS